MIKNLCNKRMHQKLSRIIKGQQQGLDYIKVPTGEWYYSSISNELHHFTKGVFETHAAVTNRPRRFHHHHTLKVIHDDAMEVVVSEWIKDDIIQGYRVKKGLPLKMGFHPKSSISTHMRDILRSSYGRLTNLLDITRTTKNR